MPAAIVRPEIVYAWKGSSLLVVNTRGECGADQPLSGLYSRETRFLSTLRLEINGIRPWLCEAAAVQPDLLSFTYVHPEITEPGGGGSGQAGDEEATDSHGIPERSLDIRVSHRVRVSGLDVTFAIVNRARQPVTFDVTVVMDADFADLQEAQSGRREQESPVAFTAGGGILEIAYTHSALQYLSRAEYPPEWQAGDKQVSSRVTLVPQEQERWVLRVVSLTDAEDVAGEAVLERETALAEWRDGFVRTEVPGNRLFEEVLRRNVRDIASFPLLTGPRDEWLALQAGVPLYPAFFGRDAVTAGWQAAYLDRGEALDAALTKLARLQSDRRDDWRDEEPGRIPYQVRSGPLAVLDINPYAAYYADYASPLMFVISLANLYAWTGERDRLMRHWDAARRILDWARTYGDADDDGFLEYRTRSTKGTKNQGWKDSGDAIVYDDGRPVPAPIAACELQGYWYLAQELMAVLCFMMDARADADAYQRSAASLKERFNRDWWMEDEQYYALALDPDKRQVRAVTSNVGHCLACGIIQRERLTAVVGRMFAPDLFSGWGIRTLSDAHAFYNPLSYHRGTVWAVEQATIIFGLRRFGFDARALDLTHALFDLAQLYPEYRIPECVGGYARADGDVPGAYPRANTPQLWNATAFVLAVQSMLGLVPLAPVETLLLDPVLPSWLPELVIRDLRVGAATVGLHFRRDENGRTTWDVLHKRGTLHLVRQPPPESLSAGFADRMRAALESILR